MGPLDALWHLGNLFGPAAGLGLIAPGLAKLLWRRELATAAWWPLARWVGGAAAVVTVGGLVLFGHDGKMATYAALVVTCALSQWLGGRHWR